MIPLNVLVVDDDPTLRMSVRSALQADGRFEVLEARNGVEAIEKVKEASVDMVLLDMDMPYKNGREALHEIKAHNPAIIVLIMTAYANLNDAVQCVREGAYNYVAKPVRSDELVELVGKALQAHAMISDVAVSAPILLDSGRKFIGNTEEMQKVFNIIHRVSKVDTPVLIRGASGTGKELVARAIHFNSSRKDNHFVAINCSAIPENLFESELFGHEKGAFTGADSRKIGKFQYAEGGTLFLDEVGDLPLLMQVKLLRVLQEKVFTPVGSNRECEANVRVIAATNRPLEEMIGNNTFRDDLFYRLNVIPIFLPSLKERKNDIAHLVKLFVRKFNHSHDRTIHGVSPSVLACFEKYDWPGNIRELENVIEHAFVLEFSNTISLKSLPEKLLQATGTQIPSIESSVAGEVAESTRVSVKEATVGGANNLNGDTGDPSANQEMIHIPGHDLDFSKQKEAFEREFIIKALKTFKGRINQTALHANIPKKTLLRKIEKYGINAKEYGEGEAST